jgi:hypothetical protein
VSRYIDEHRGRFGVEPICRTLGLSASAYYQGKIGERSARAVEDERLLGRIRELQPDRPVLSQVLGGLVFFAFVIDAFSRKVRSVMSPTDSPGDRNSCKPWTSGAETRPELLHRTQEVAGSSPATSIREVPAPWVFPLPPNPRRSPRIALPFRH